MTVALDCKAVDKTDPNNHYWASVGVNLAGDPDYSNLNGLSIIDDAIDPEGATVKALCWDMSKLASVTIEGKVQGYIKLHLTGVKSDKKIGVAAYKIAGGETELEDISETITMDKFKASDWGGAAWDDIKAQVHEMSLELNTEEDDYANLKINAIIFNFKTEADMNETFPFLAN